MLDHDLGNYTRAPGSTDAQGNCKFALTHLSWQWKGQTSHLSQNRHAQVSKPSWRGRDMQSVIPINNPLWLGNPVSTARPRQILETCLSQRELANMYPGANNHLQTVHLGFSALQRKSVQRRRASQSFLKRKAEVRYFWLMCGDHLDSC